MQDDGKRYKWALARRGKLLCRVKGLRAWHQTTARAEHAARIAQRITDEVPTEAIVR